MIKSLILTLPLLAFCLPDAEARMYKCKMPDGSVTFSDTQCFAKDVKIERIDRKNYTEIENSARSSYEILNLCGTVYPEEDAMRETCVSAQASAYTQLIKLSDLYAEGSEPHQTKQECIEASRENGGPADYPKALRCTRQHLNNP